MLAGTRSAAGTVSGPGSPSPQRLPAGVRLAAQRKGNKLGNGVGVPAPPAKLRDGREGGLACPWLLPPAALPAHRPLTMRRAGPVVLGTAQPAVAGAQARARG